MNKNQKLPFMVSPGFERTMKYLFMQDKYGVQHVCSHILDVEYSPNVGITLGDNNFARLLTVEGKASLLCRSEWKALWQMIDHRFGFSEEGE